MTNASKSGDRAVTVYEGTRTGIPKLRPYFRQLWIRRPLIWNLARSELKSQHYDTAFGQVWLIINPLLMALVWIFVRSIIRPLGSADERNDLITHLVAGFFFFQLSAEIVTGGARAIIANSRMVLNTAVPRMVFPIVVCVRALMNFLPAIAVYFVIHAVLGQPFGLSLLWIVPLLVLQVMFSLGMALLLAPLAVTFRDTLMFLRYFVRLWMFMSPILYRVKEIKPEIRAYLAWNPLFPIFAALEQIFDAEAPSMGYVLAAVAWATASLIIGATYFMKKESNIAVRL